MQEDPCQTDPDKLDTPPPDAVTDHDGDDTTDPSLIEPGVLCAHCMTINRPIDEFCSHCGMPIGQYVMNQPFQSIMAQGWAYRRASTGRVSKMLVIGMWAMFLPLVLGGIRLNDMTPVTAAVPDTYHVHPIAVTYPIEVLTKAYRKYGSFEEAMKHQYEWMPAPQLTWIDFAIVAIRLFAILALMVLYIWLLVRVTRNYRRQKREPAAEAS